MKYFTKYLPVDGEITDIGVAYKSKKFPNLGAKFSTAPWDKKVMEFYDIEKVKLFLCSRDIQVGDKVQGTIIKGDNVYVHNEMQGYSVADTLHYISLEEAQMMEAYKVIGEISPYALSFVKEGDEFENSEWRFNLDQMKPPFIEIKGPCGHFH